MDAQHCRPVYVTPFHNSQPNFIPLPQARDENFSRNRYRSVVVNRDRVERTIVVDLNYAFLLTLMSV
jgi:hypothetical protein